jgi:hypothetical protein
MNHHEKLAQNGNTATPEKPTHHAIKMITEDQELSSGLQRSRSSSIQLHVPIFQLTPSPSGSISNASGVGAAGGSHGLATISEKPQHVDLDMLAARDAIDPPLPSPSFLKPFRQQQYPTGPKARRKSLVYAVAIIGSSIAFVCLLIFSLAQSNSAANARIRQHAMHLSSSSSHNIVRFSSYVGSYIPFISNNAAFAGLTSSAILFGHAAPGVQTLHPILPILTQARAKQSQLIKRQSTAYQQAISQYRKRYGQDPPKGFDKWWSFAKARNHTMVDEYDSMMVDLNAFTVLSAEELKLRTRTLGQLPGVSLLSIKGGKATIHSKSGKWAPALALQEMMNAFVGQLPDMEIAVNEKPEGRVLPARWKDIDAEEWADEEFAREINSGAST